MALRNLLTFKRNKRAQKLVAAKGLFADMDADGSDEITREELEFGLSILQGKDANKDTVAKLVEEVDLGELLTAVWL
jgi:Ca2+-binding EF-hand superfamily protein